MCHRLRCCIRHHAQTSFDRMHDHLRRDGRFAGRCRIGPCAGDAGRAGAGRLQHHEGRLETDLGRAGYRVALEILTATAVDGDIAAETVDRYRVWFSIRDTRDGVALPRSIMCCTCCSTMATWNPGTAVIGSSPGSWRTGGAGATGNSSCVCLNGGAENGSRADGCDRQEIQSGISLDRRTGRDLLRPDGRVRIPDRSAARMLGQRQHPSDRRPPAISCFRCGQRWSGNSGWSRGWPGKSRRLPRTYAGNCLSGPTARLRDADRSGHGLHARPVRLSARTFGGEDVVGQHQGRVRPLAGDGCRP